MTPYDHLLVERDPHLDGLLTVTLDRPEKLNALSIAVHDELQHLCAALETDHEIRVVLLTGAGRAFSLSGRSSVTVINPGSSRSRSTCRRS